MIGCIRILPDHSRVGVIFRRHPPQYEWQSDPMAKASHSLPDLFCGSHFRGFYLELVTACANPSEAGFHYRYQEYQVQRSGTQRHQETRAHRL